MRDIHPQKSKHCTENEVFHEVLKTSAVNVTKSFIEEILNGKLQFLCSVSSKNLKTCQILISQENKT